MNWTTLPFTVQLGLGVGFLAYVTAYAGRRRGHSISEITFLTMAFGLPALLPLINGTGPVAANAIIGVMMAFGVALIWRGWALEAWQWAAKSIGLHAEDGLSFGWDKIVSYPNLATNQISVHTADGRILYLNDRTRFANAPFNGLYLASDGSIIMVVEEERMPDGSEQVRQNINHDTWGARMTYIPSDQVKRVNIRF
ncbi:hypothetical protein [Cypionkella sinensis]|uniref:Uncharacterized protein n=1 Tax=Cypionkella sinensis TaxID=1756043 RepID=A0ABV7IVI2_9RHOB